MNQMITLTNDNIDSNNINRYHINHDAINNLVFGHIVDVITLTDW